MNGCSVWAFVNVFGKPAEVGSGGSRSGGQTGFARELVRNSSLLRHVFGMFSGGDGQGFIRSQSWQSVGFALLVHRTQQFLLRLGTLTLRHATGEERDQYSDQNRYLMLSFHETLVGNLSVATVKTQLVEFSLAGNFV